VRPRNLLQGHRDGKLIKYRLSLPSEAVRARLETAADRPTPRYWILPGTTHGRPVVGEVTANRFWWRIRHKERASFAPWLSGRILSQPSGSTVVIELHSPMTRKVRIVIGAAVILLSILWIALTPHPSVLTFVVAAAAIIVVILFPLLGTRLYAEEQRQLRKTFEDAFAQQIEGD